MDWQGAGQRDLPHGVAGRTGKEGKTDWEIEDRPRLRRCLIRLEEQVIRNEGEGLGKQYD